MQIQEYSSKFTSVNSTRLPAIFGKIKWKELLEWTQQCLKETRPRVLDFGCGRNPELAKEFVESFGFQYFGYDPYWLLDRENEKALNCSPNIVICTNVLNVISSWTLQAYIHRQIRDMTPFYFISVYPGDGSGEGKETKKNCWQWNRPLEDYRVDECELTKNRIMTSAHGFDFIK